MRPSISHLFAPTGVALLAAIGCAASTASPTGAADAPRAAAAVATGTSTATKRAGKPRRPAPALPTCDELQGATVRTSLHWRIFRPHPSETFGDPGDLWACRRAPGPATRFTFIGGLTRVQSVAGDLVQIANSGRYNAYTYALDLATGRFTTVEGDETTRELLGSGALVPVPAVTPAGGVSAYAENPAYASFGADDAPGAGYYATGADGAPIRVVPEVPPVATTTAGWEYAGPGTRFIKMAGPGAVTKAGFKAALHPGVTVTPMLGDGYQLESRRGRGGRRATLVIRRPNAVAYGREPRQSNLVARLVPGTGREAYAAGSDVIVGRFLDRPGELRARVLASSKVGRNPTYLFDLPAPGQRNAVATAYTGDIAVATDDRISVYVRSDRDSRYSLQTRAAPGARDIALAPVGSGTEILYWTDVDGRPHREIITRTA